MEVEKILITFSCCRQLWQFSKKESSNFFSFLAIFFQETGICDIIFFLLKTIHQNAKKSPQKRNH
jgi:hypothetical protein